MRELYPGIKIRKKFAIIDQQETYLFYLDVQDLKIIDFECDFTGSDNISIKSRANHEKIVAKTVEPREVTLVAQVELHEGWKLQSTFRYVSPISDSEEDPSQKKNSCSTYTLKFQPSKVKKL